MSNYDTEKVKEILKLTSSAEVREVPQALLDFANLIMRGEIGKPETVEVMRFCSKFIEFTIEKNVQLHLKIFESMSNAVHNAAVLFNRGAVVPYLQKLELATELGRLIGFDGANIKELVNEEQKLIKELKNAPQN